MAQWTKIRFKEEVIIETNAYFMELDRSYYTAGIKELENHWSKCNDLKGDCVEK